MFIHEQLVVQKKNTNEVNYMAVIKGKRQTQNKEGGTYSRDFRYIVVIEPNKNFPYELKFYELQMFDSHGRSLSHSKTLINIIDSSFEQYSGQNASEWYRWGKAKLDEFVDLINNGEWFA